MIIDSLSPSVSNILSLALLSLGFSFSPRKPFFIPPYGAALRHTHSSLPYNRIFPSGSFICTLNNLLEYFFLHFFTSFPVFVVFLEISVDNRQIHPLCKIRNYLYFLISRSNTVPPHYFFIPYAFPSPTCPFRSAPSSILSCSDTLSINLSIQVLTKIIFLLHAINIFNLWNIRAYYVEY